MIKQALAITAISCLAAQVLAQAPAPAAAPPATTERTDLAPEPRDTPSPAPDSPATDAARAAEPPVAAVRAPAAGEAPPSQAGGQAAAGPDPVDTRKEADTSDIRAATHQRMVALMEEERYAEAVDAAKAVVKLTENEFGANSIELVPPLDNLGKALRLRGDLVSAEQAYQRSIAIIRQQDGQLSPKLVDPYFGLGATYYRGGLFEKAEEAFSTALRLNNVNEGFYNLEQMKIRDGLTETYLGLQEPEEANFHQEIQLEILQRRLGPSNPETAPALYKLAKWYERQGLMDDAQYAYRQAQQLVRKAYGRDSMEMVPALEGMAANYDLQGLMSQSAANLKKALEIVESQPEVDREKQAKLLVKLGDLYDAAGRFDTAIAYYERGWQALSPEDRFAGLRDELFSRPARISGLPWSSLRFASGDVRNWNALSDGYVLVRYDVTAKGRADEVVIVESEPPELMDRRVSETLRRSHFRPRFADGVAVETKDLMYRHNFRYLPEDDGADDSAGEPLEAPDSGGRLEYPDGSDD